MEKSTRNWLAVAVASAVMELAGAAGATPSTVSESASDRTRRRDEIVRSWVWRLKDRNSVLPAWDDYAGGAGNGDANASLRMITAGMGVFANPERFSQAEFSILSGLAQGSSVADHMGAFKRKVGAYFATASVIHPVGTDNDQGRYVTSQPWVQSAWYTNSDGKWGVGACNNSWWYGKADYDFVLREIALLVYSFRDRPDLLSNDMITNLIVQNTAQPTIPFSGQGTELSGVYAKDYDAADFVVGQVNIKVKQPETENHTLGIYQWQYLINNYVRWTASLPSTHPRYNAALKKFYDANPAQYNNTKGFTDWVTAMLTRVSRRGLFESEARMYESVSYSAILNFASYASVLFPQDADCNRVRSAALNALDYLSADFIFNSFKGKRMGSRRRNNETSYKNDVGLYSHDYMANMVGMLTGAYSFADASCAGMTGTAADAGLLAGLPPEPYCHLTAQEQPMAFALATAFAEYQLPDVLVKYALNPGAGWEATSQTKYARSEYEPASTWSTGTPDTPGDRFPNYSYEPQAADNVFSVRNKSFVTNSYANFSGGKAEVFLPQSKKVSILGMGVYTVHDASFGLLNTITAPNFLIGSGNIGWWSTPVEAASSVPTSYSYANAGKAFATACDFGASYGNTTDPTQAYQNSTDMATYKSISAVTTYGRHDCGGVYAATAGSTSYGGNVWGGNSGLSAIGIPSSWTSNLLKLKTAPKLVGATSFPPPAFTACQSGSTCTGGNISFAVSFPVWPMRIDVFDVESVGYGPNYYIAFHCGPIEFWDIASKDLVAKAGGLTSFGTNYLATVQANVAGSDIVYNRPYVVASTGAIATEKVHLYIGDLEGNNEAMGTTGIRIEVDGANVSNEAPLLRVREIDNGQKFTGFNIVDQTQEGYMTVCDRESHGDCLVIDSRDRFNPSNTARRYRNSTYLQLLQ